jgi:hypothetical protein
MQLNFYPLHGTNTLLDIPGLQEVWATTRGDAGVCIAVLDGPVDLDCPILRGADLTAVGDPGVPASLNGPAAAHGTHVTSIIFAQRGGAIEGVAPHCRGLIVPIFQDDEQGGIRTCSQSRLAAAIVTAVNLGAQVINVSAGQLSDPGLVSQALGEAILYCQKNDRLIVAATGNDGCAECLHVPGGVASDAVLAVGALDARGLPHPMNNWGATYQLQGILAPGEDIPGAVPGGGTARRSGTSFATAIVSGVAGLLLSLLRARGLPASPRAIRSALLTGAADCPAKPAQGCGPLLAGRLEVAAAAAFVLPPPGPTPTTNRSMALKIPPLGENAMTNGSPEPKSPPNGGSVPNADGAQQYPPGGPPGAAAAAGAPADGVLPSGCGCGGSGGGGKGARQFVYVVGDRLDYDFGTRVREQSLQDNFASSVLDIDIGEASLRVRPNMLRYLLGWDGVTGTRGRPEKATDLKVNGNLYDVKSVHWVLYDNDCPRYALQPLGPFAAEGYKQLLYFFIEHYGIQLSDFGISAACLNEFFTCHGGTSDPLEPGPKQAAAKSAPPDASPQGAGRGADDVANLLNEPPGRVARIAVAGEVVGTAQLGTGETVEILAPDLRGTASWNTQRLLDALLGSNALATADGAREFVGRVVAKLYEESQNDGKSPQSRAVNWATTSAIRDLQNFFLNDTFRRFLGGLENAAVNEVTVQESTCRRTGLEFDVAISLFSFENTMRGEIVLTTSVDVSDVVPVTLGRTRVSTKR